MLTINELSAKTESGYSFDRYGRSGWNGAIRVLRSCGLNDKQIETFLLSKHMRWAGDFDIKQRRHCNGQTITHYLANENMKEITEQLNKWAKEQ